MVQTYDWQDFIRYGQKCGTTGGHNGMPWSFTFHGLPVTHENDQLYLICHPESAGPMLFTPNDLIAVGDGKTVVLQNAMKRQHDPRLNANGPRILYQAFQGAEIQEVNTWMNIERLLAQALNFHSIDAKVETPDYKLAEILVQTMKAKQKEAQE